MFKVDSLILCVMLETKRRENIWYRFICLLRYITHFMYKKAEFAVYCLVKCLMLLSQLYIKLSHILIRNFLVS